MFAMMKEEKSCDYLCRKRSNDADNTFVTQSDRTAVVDWIYSIVDTCGFDLGLVAMAMGMVDRFLSKPSIIAQDALHDSRQFQLVAVAAFSICIKTEQKVTAGIEFLTDVSRKLYSSLEIRDMASTIIEGLSSGIHAPTSIQLAQHFLSLALPGINLEASRWTCVLDDVRFQLEYSVRDYFFTTQWPRTVAMAAILNALDHVTGRDRQVILRVFPPILGEYFPSLTDLIAAKTRLRVTMERDKFADDTTDVSDIIIASLESSTEALNLPGFSLASCA